MVATPNIHPPSGGPKPPPKSFNPKKDSPMAGGSVDGINSKQNSKNTGSNFQATHPDGSEGGSHNPESAKRLFGGNKNQNSQGQTQPQQPPKNGRLQTAHGAHQVEGGTKFDRLKSTLKDAYQQGKQGDLRKGAAVVADEYLGLGEKVGDLLFSVWLTLTVSLTIGGFIIGGIIPLIIFNMLLFSPKTVYRITEIILDLIPTGVTQAIATFAEEVGLDNLKITIRGFEKAIIILVDLIILAIIGIIVTVLVYSFCSLVLPSSFTDKVKLFVSDPVKGATQAAAGFVLPKELVDFCQSQFGGGGDFGGGGATDSFGGGVTVDPSPDAGKCIQVEGTGISCSAGCVRKDPAICNHKYDEFIKEASQRYGIDVNIIRAIIQQESQWNPRAGSPAGAVGLMQILPSTWQSNGCSGSYFDPRSNILCGTKYIKEISGTLTQRDGASVGSNLRYISAAYNAGPGTVGRSGRPNSGPFARGPYCTDQFQWECAFGNKAHTVCSRNGWKETRNYAVSVPHYYKEYSSGSCPIN